MMQAAWLAIIVVLATASRTGADDNVLTAQERADGWVLLFDGKTTKGWMTPKGQPLPEKHVQDGGLNPHPCDYMLVHEKVWENFRLSLDFRFPRNATAAFSFAHFR